MENKRLMRDREHAMVLGVCAGVANYLEIDPTVVRVIWAILVLVFGSGVLLYFFMALIMPTY